MYKTIRTFSFSVILMLVSSQIFSQINTSSPYSRYGIGIIEKQASATGQMLGGLGVGIRYPFDINLMNPASFSSMPRQSFLFQASVRSRQTNYSDKTGSAKYYDNGLTSIALAFRPGTFWSAGISLVPYSSVGYEIVSQDSLVINNRINKIATKYTGIGGLNKATLTNCFSYKNISLGINASYYFGSVNQLKETALIDSVFNSIIRQETDFRIKDFNVDLGLQYSDSITEDFQYTIGLKYQTARDLKADQTRFSFVKYGNYSDTVTSDTVNSGKVGMPASYGFGASIQTKKIIAGIDFTTQNWKDVKFFNQIQSDLVNSYSVAAGFEYTPDIRSKNLLKSINYRIGFNYTNSYLKLNGNQLVDKAVTFGFGVPIKKSSTKINLGFQIGQNGTQSNGLIEEKYYIMNLSFNMGDLWFVKRKFN